MKINTCSVKLLNIRKCLFYYFRKILQWSIKKSIKNNLTLCILFLSYLIIGLSCNINKEENNLIEIKGAFYFELTVDENILGYSNSTNDKTPYLVKKYLIALALSGIRFLEYVKDENDVTLDKVKLFTSEDNRIIKVYSSFEDMYYLINKSGIIYNDITENIWIICSLYRPYDPTLDKGKKIFCNKNIRFYEIENVSLSSFYYGKKHNYYFLNDATGIDYTYTDK